MDNNVSFERQQALNLSIPDAVAVVGCGGVGSWTAYLLALAGVPKLWLFDGDTISDHNLNRIPLPASMVGAPKSAAIASLIKSIRPDCAVVPMGEFSPDLADKIAISLEISYIIATTDTLRSRKMVETWARKAYVAYLEAAAEGDYGSATGESAAWSTPEEENPGYASVPVWAGPCILAASIAVSTVVHDGVLADRTIRLGYNAGTGFDIFDSANRPEVVEEEGDGVFIPFQLIEHINGDTTDNRPENLRIIVATQENITNVAT